MYDKDSIDARTFSQVWCSLSPAMQAELRCELTGKGECTRQAVWAWTKGVTPRSLATRKRVERILNNYLRIHTSHLTLFPNV